MIRVNHLSFRWTVSPFRSDIFSSIDKIGGWGTTLEFVASVLHIVVIIDLCGIYREVHTYYEGPITIKVAQDL